MQASFLTHHWDRALAHEEVLPRRNHSHTVLKNAIFSSQNWWGKLDVPVSPLWQSLLASSGLHILSLKGPCNTVLLSPSLSPRWGQGLRLWGSSWGWAGAPRVEPGRSPATAAWAVTEDRPWHHFRDGSLQVCVPLVLNYVLLELSAIGFHCREILAKNTKSEEFDTGQLSGYISVSVK